MFFIGCCEKLCNRLFGTQRTLEDTTKLVSSKEDILIEANSKEEDVTNDAEQLVAPAPADMPPRASMQVPGVRVTQEELEEAKSNLGLRLRHPRR